MEMGGIGFCCGEQSLMMVRVTLTNLFVDVFPNRQGMLTNQKKTLILVKKSTDCLDWY